MWLDEHAYKNIGKKARSVSLLLKTMPLTLTLNPIALPFQSKMVYLLYYILYGVTEIQIQVDSQHRQGEHAA